MKKPKKLNISDNVASNIFESCKDCEGQNVDRQSWCMKAYPEYLGGKHEKHGISCKICQEVFNTESHPTVVPSTQLIRHALFKHKAHIHMKEKFNLQVCWAHTCSISSS